MSMNLRMSSIRAPLCSLPDTSPREKTGAESVAGLQQSVDRSEIVGEDLASLIIGWRVGSKRSQPITERRQQDPFIINERSGTGGERRERHFLGRFRGQENDIVGLTRRERVNLRENTLEGFVE